MQVDLYVLEGQGPFFLDRGALGRRLYGETAIQWPGFFL